MNKPIGLLIIPMFILSACSGLERPPEALSFAVDAPPPSLAASESPTQAEKKPDVPSEEDLKEANNPLANRKTINLHNYYMPEISGTDRTANALWLRYAQPIRTKSSTWLLRASVPLLRVPSGPTTEDSGLGDSNVFATYLIDSGKPGLSVGVGPLLGIPTAMKDALGTDQWSLGLAAVAYDSRSSVFQYGTLLTYQHKMFGSDRAPDVNHMVLQPFGMLQLGNGNYLRSSPIWVFDFQQGYYNVPIGLGYGKVFDVGKTVFNIFVEPQATVLSDGPGQPEFQVFFGMNVQLK